MHAMSPKKIFYILSFVAAAAPLAVFSATPTQITVNSNLPGVNPGSAGIGGLIANFYTFALAIAGILAFGAIVWGGVKYAAGAGNPSSQSEGKEWIKGALLGLLLLAGAWIVLYTVNPAIVTLEVPGLPTLQQPTPLTSGNSGGSGTGVTTCTPGCTPPDVCVLDAASGLTKCQTGVYACRGYTDSDKQSGPILNRCATSLSLCSDQFNAPFTGQNPICLQSEGSCKIINISQCGKP